MESFEDVRAHVAAHYPLRDSDPYLISLELDLGQGRRQSLFLVELEGDSGEDRRTLRISTPIAPMGDTDASKCLRFNWEQRVGYFALSDLEGVPYLQLCENRPYAGLTADELDRVISELGVLADRLELLMHEGRDTA